jgi:hypothetical protein
MLCIRHCYVVPHAFDTIANSYWKWCWMSYVYVRDIEAQE